MRWLLRKCPQCGLYTFQESCPKCYEKTYVAHPPRFSPTDRYVRYRLILKSVDKF